MQRIIVTGGSGTGKSTLARAMGLRLGLPVIHLDREFWRPGWVAPEPAEFRARCAELAAGERWVMDGSYSATWDVRIPSADGVVWLDLPRWIYFPRVVKRLVVNYGRVREDVAPGCPERFEAGFLTDWVWGYPKRRPETIRRLEAARDAGKTVIVLRRPREVRDFLARLPHSLADESAAKLTP